MFVKCVSSFVISHVLSKMVVVSNNNQLGGQIVGYYAVPCPSGLSFSPCSSFFLLVHHNALIRSKVLISDIGIISDEVFFISDIWGDIGDTRAYRAFILDTIYNEILIIKS